MLIPHVAACPQAHHSTEPRPAHATFSSGPIPAFTPPSTAFSLICDVSWSASSDAPRHLPDRVAPLRHSESSSPLGPVMVRVQMPDPCWVLFDVFSCDSESHNWLGLGFYTNETVLQSVRRHSESARCPTTCILVKWPPLTSTGWANSDAYMYLTRTSLPSEAAGSIRVCWDIGSTHSRDVGQAYNINMLLSVFLSISSVFLRIRQYTVFILS